MVCAHHASCEGETGSIRNNFPPYKHTWNQPGQILINFKSTSTHVDTWNSAVRERASKLLTNLIEFAWFKVLFDELSVEHVLETWRLHRPNVLPLAVLVVVLSEINLLENPIKICAVLVR